MTNFFGKRLFGTRTRSRSRRRSRRRSSTVRKQTKPSQLSQKTKRRLAHMLTAATAVAGTVGTMYLYKELKKKMEKQKLRTTNKAWRATDEGAPAYVSTVAAAKAAAKIKAPAEFKTTEELLEKKLGLTKAQAKRGTKKAAALSGKHSRLAIKRQQKKAQPTVKHTAVQKTAVKQGPQMFQKGQVVTFVNLNRHDAIEFAHCNGVVVNPNMSNGRVGVEIQSGKQKGKFKMCSPDELKIKKKDQALIRKAAQIWRTGVPAPAPTPPYQLKHHVLKGNPLYTGKS